MRPEFRSLLQVTVGNTSDYPKPVIDHCRLFVIATIRSVHAIHTPSRQIPRLGPRRGPFIGYCTPNYCMALISRRQAGFKISTVYQLISLVGATREIPPPHPNNTRVSKPTTRVWRHTRARASERSLMENKAPQNKHHLRGNGGAVSGVAPFDHMLLSVPWECR